MSRLVLQPAGRGADRERRAVRPGLLTAASGSFPLGSTIEVTNLDTNKSVRVRVSDKSGMCALLTPGAFERIRTPSKNLIRNGVVRQVG